MPQLFIYAGFTGAGYIKVGSAFSPLKRQSNFRTEDPEYKLAYTSPIDSRAQEQLVHKKLRLTGRHISREVYDLPFELVVSTIEGRPALNVGAPNLLKAVLKAKLAPDLTVEDACHTEMHYNIELAPKVEEIMAHRRLLYRAGLSFSLGDETLPDAIVLEDPLAFQKTFPDLVLAIPLLMAGEGVRPYTNGQPRVVKRPALVHVK